MKVLPAGEVCTVIETGGSRFVRTKAAGVATPLAVAVTVKGPPAVPLAENADAVATPAASVKAAVVFVPFANVPLAPVAGAVNSTEMPGTGLLFTSRTVMDKAFPKA